MRLRGGFRVSVYVAGQEKYHGKSANDGLMMTMAGVLREAMGPFFSFSPSQRRGDGALCLLSTALFLFAMLLASFVLVLSGATSKLLVLFYDLDLCTSRMATISTPPFDTRPL